MREPFMFYSLIALFIFSLAGSVYAGISVDPGLIEIVALREQEVIQKVRVINTGDLPVDVDVGLSKFSSEEISPSIWIIVEPQRFELKPGEVREVICRFKPTKDAEGELRARLCISGKEVGEGSSPIGIRFNMALYVAVQNTVKLDVEIEKINISCKNNEIQGDILLNNKSNVHIRPDIEIIVKDLEDNLIGNINVPFGQVAQKGVAKTFIFKEKIHLKPDKYKILANVDYGKFYGQKDYIATKESEFEVKSPEPETEEAGPVAEEKTEEALSESEIEDDSGL